MQIFEEMRATATNEDKAYSQISACLGNLDDKLVVIQTESKHATLLGFIRQDSHYHVLAEDKK